MNCTKCDLQLPEGCQVCPQCGEALHYENPPAPAPKDPGELLGLISMILGFVSIGTQVLGSNANLSMPAAIGALVCGFLAKNRAAEKGLENSKAKTGIICGFVGIGVSILYAFIAIAILVLYFAFFLSLAAMEGV